MIFHTCTNVYWYKTALFGFIMIYLRYLKCNISYDTLYNHYYFTINHRVDLSCLG